MTTKKVKTKKKKDKFLVDSGWHYDKESRCLIRKWPRYEKKEEKE